MTIELRHLRYFIAVAEELSFRRAAERLHMSQPPLSQQIRSLETDLGVELLARTRHKVELTDAGRAYLQEARAVLAAADAAAEVARRTASGELGTLTVGFVGSAMYGRLPELLRRFRAERSDVRLDLRELSSTAQVGALLSGAIDLGFLRPPVAEARLVLEVFESEPLVAVLPVDHPLAGRPLIDLGLLRDEPMVLLEAKDAPGLRRAMTRALAGTGGAPRVVQETHEIQTAIGLVAAGLGISLVPASVRALDRHDVVYRELEGDPPQVALALCRRAAEPTAVVSAFLRVLAAFG